MDQYQTAFSLMSREDVTKKLQEADRKKQVKMALQGIQTRWMCQNCTFVNDMNDLSCAVCELGWTGQRECPRDKWACQYCSFFNQKSDFYCEVCNRAKPDLTNLRL